MYKQTAKLKLLTGLLILSLPFPLLAQRNVKQTTNKFSAYLFAYFTGNGKDEEAIHFALSDDGYHYKALNADQPVLSSKTISSTGGVRDPHIMRAEDGKTFYMVATDMHVAVNGWKANYAMVLLKSTDLINWTSNIVNIPKNFREFAKINRVWAPQTIYDPVKKKYMVYWSMRFGEGPDKIYYAYANKDFSGLETTPKQLFFKPDNGACIDGTIVRKDGKYHLFFKTEGKGAGIQEAVSDKINTGYVWKDKYLDQTDDAVEGADVFKLNNSDTWILMYDVYMKGKYEFCKSTDLQNFSVIDTGISMDFHPRHGTVMSITDQEKQALKAKWPQTVKMNNPVLKGLYADPDIIYSEAKGKFYLYPTSDGFDGWSGTSFKTFSSSDLVNWKDEGVILDLPKDVSWGKRNAWAPTMAEKKINGKYTYFYYFCAAQKIGVAVSDSPTGPFKDSGAPLLDHFPETITSGQQIDPAVFTDPQSGKSYLYWGNGYFAGAELTADMMHIKPGTTQILTPDQTFREGCYVFFRNGKYYFMWSEDDTRSPNYRVRYGTSDTPLGKIEFSKDNLVLAKDEAAGIYATGHNSVIQIPGRDEWYIVYHRFNYPNGIKMGDAAGFNREVCIDKLEFREDGSIRQVKPTHRGIDPVVLDVKR